MVLATWTAHPAKQRPRDLVLVIAVVCLTMGAVLASFESLFLAGLAAVVLIAAVSSFLLPTRYTITDVDISEKRLWRYKARQWAELRRLQIGPGAALVSPFARPHWLDRYRGLVVMFDGAPRDEVIAILRGRMTREAVKNEVMTHP